MQEFLLSLMNRFGYAGIFLLITLENLIPPIPSELILTMGGFMTTYTSLHVPGVILFSTMGSLLGAIILYYTGKLLNQERLLHLAQSRLGKRFRIKAEDIHSSFSRFDQKGSRAVFFCRFVPILRSLISIPAGMRNMHQGRFLLYTAAGSLIWNTVLITAGNLAGTSWKSISVLFTQYSHVTKWILLLLCLAVAGVRFYRKHFHP